MTKGAGQSSQIGTKNVKYDTSASARFINNWRYISN